MQTFLLISQLIVSALLVTAILLQQKGTGLGAAFGGGSEIYSTKRGAEKVLHNSTIVLSIIFCGLGLAHLLVA